MEIYLPTNNFSFLKILLGIPILTSAFFFPILVYIPIIILILGKAHSLGAWIAIWKSGKFNWIYLFWLSFFTISISVWGIKASSVVTLSFISFILFAFHFVFDEFDLQEEQRTLGNALSGVTPFALTFLFLLHDFAFIHLTTNFFLFITATLIFIEMFFLQKITWFFVQSKLLTLFILVSFILGSGVTSVLYIFLISHYLFWFIYPVYKLHKYRRSERDGFIMLLLVIVLMSVFVYSTLIWNIPDNDDFAIRTFFVATILHILTTAPFGYLFGLPKPIQYNS